MSIEAIPEQYRQPFDPLKGIDHERVALYTRGRLSSGEGVREGLQGAYSFNQRLSPALLERLIGYGKYLEPYDDNLDALDDTFQRVRAFSSGAAVALAAIANLAYELNIDQLKWREEWINLPDNLDAPLSITVNRKATPDDCYKIGSALMDIGNANVRNLEMPYQTLIEDIDQAYPRDGVVSNALKASFGYVFGTGRRIVENMAYEQAIEETVRGEIPDTDRPDGLSALDREYEELVAPEVD